ncbi:hypothetical protein TSUD_127800 [Trifolium subterraneum]|nr:hypothetical protein TSUD_127800 [Trifolium subterraneum]
MESNKASSSMEVDTVLSEAKVLPPKPKFKPLKPHEMATGQVQFRKVSVPPHRYKPLEKAWMEFYTPIYEQMKIDIRMNFNGRKVELKTMPDTPDISNLQKCADFVHAFMLGFDVKDAIAILRLDELYIDSFEIKDVKTLRGNHLSRAIGRLSGKGGKTKFTIENATRTRIVIADTKIHILGSFENIKVARDRLCSLIKGSPAGKVCSKLRDITSKMEKRLTTELERSLLSQYGVYGSLEMVDCGTCCTKKPLMLFDVETLYYMIGAMHSWCHSMLLTIVLSGLL